MKVLDFGLAKAFDPAPEGDPSGGAPLRFMAGLLGGLPYASDVGARGAGDLPAFFGPVITGEQRQLKFVVRLRVLPGQREPALPASALRHPSQP